MGGCPGKPGEPSGGRWSGGEQEEHGGDEDEEEEKEGDDAELPRVLVNATPLSSLEPMELKDRDCLIFGYAHSFRLVI